MAQTTGRYPSPPYLSEIYPESTRIMNPGWRGWFTRLVNKLSNYTNAVTSVTPTGSPFGYQNISGFDEDVVVSGGTVSNVQLARQGVGVNIASSTAQPVTVHLSPGDILNVTYSVAPTIQVIPR